MAQTLYEAMFIFDSGRYSRDSAGVVAEVEGVIRTHGGEIEVSRHYEERRLAYPIKGHRKGTYWLIYFRIDGPQIVLLNRQFEISDTVLRHLILKVHPKLEEAVLAHAEGRVLADTDSAEGTDTEESPELEAAVERAAVTVGEQV